MVYPFVPQVTITPRFTFLERIRIMFGHILSAIVPGVDDDFLPSIRPTTAEAFAAHTASNLRIIETFSFVISFYFGLVCHITGAESPTKIVAILKIKKFLHIRIPHFILYYSASQITILF